MTYGTHYLYYKDMERPEDYHDINNAAPGMISNPEIYQQQAPAQTANEVYKTAQEFTEGYIEKNAEIGIYNGDIVKSLENIIARDPGFNVYNWNEETQRQVREKAIVILTWDQDGKEAHRHLRDRLPDPTRELFKRVLRDTNDFSREHPGEYPDEGLDIEQKIYNYEQTRKMSKEAEQARKERVRAQKNEEEGNWFERARGAARDFLSKK